MGPGVPAQGILPPNASAPFTPRIRRPGPPWQPRHPQEVTLQQRGPAGHPGQPGGPPGAIMHPGPPGPPQGHPVFASQEPQSQPPPPVPQGEAPPVPPDNPQTEEDRQKVARYEQWLTQQEQAINQQLQYYEKEISKLRKQKKVRMSFCEILCRLFEISFITKPVGLWDGSYIF